MPRYSMKPLPVASSMAAGVHGRRSSPNRYNQFMSTTKTVQLMQEAFQHRDFCNQWTDQLSFAIASMIRALAIAPGTIDEEHFSDTPRRVVDSFIDLFSG